MKLYCKNLVLCDSSGRLLRPEESPVFYYAENYSVEIQSLDGNFPAGQWFLALASGFSPSESPRLAFAELELETAGATLSFSGLDCRTLGMLEATSGSPCRPGIIQCSRLAGSPAGTSLEHRLMTLARLGGIACDNTLTPSAVSANAICIGTNGHWYINGIDTGVSATGGGGGTSDYNALTNKPAIDGVTLASTTSLAGIGAASSVHTHPQSDVTGLATSLAGKASLQGGTVPASQLPPIPAAAHDAAITITQGTATLGTFTTDQAVPATISIPEPPSGVSDVIVGGTSVVSGGTAELPEMVMQITEVTTVTSDTLTVEPGKAYDWKPSGLSLVIQLAEGVDCTKAWSSLVRLDRLSQTGAWWNTSLTAFGQSMSKYLSAYNYVQFFTAFSHLDGTVFLTPYKIRVASNASSAGASGPGLVSVIHSKGIVLDSNGFLTVQSVTSADIDTPISSNVRIITVSSKNRTVRSVLPLVTVIPAATQAFSLIDQGANTNNHSADYEHTPSAPPMYTLPEITDATVRHIITLEVKFSTVTSLSFRTTGGTVIPVSADISIGDVWLFTCRWSSLSQKWVIKAEKEA